MNKSTRKATRRKTPPAAPYQPAYVPSSLTPAEQERVRGLLDFDLCNREVERVAGNIANALANEDTPDDVRAVIKAYLADLFTEDPTEDPELIRILYPLACRRISQRPFVPRLLTIEALTGGDKAKAITEAKEMLDEGGFTATSVSPPSESPR